MDNESVIGAVIMAVCCFGCGLTFDGIAMWAKKSSKPINFWSGTQVDPEKVTDIPAYNQANAVMWIVYSIPFWLAGLAGCFGFLGEVFTMISAVLLAVACIPGGFLLVWQYRRIEKKYIQE